LAKQKILKTYQDPTTGVTVTVFATPKPRRKKSRVHAGFVSCTTDFTHISDDKVARLSLSHRANGEGN
jgi:hypothetical protein